MQSSLIICARWAALPEDTCQTLSVQQREAVRFLLTCTLIYPHARRKIHTNISSYSGWGSWVSVRGTPGVCGVVLHVSTAWLQRTTTPRGLQSQGDNIGNHTHLNTQTSISSTFTFIRVSENFSFSVVFQNIKQKHWNFYKKETFKKPHHFDVRKLFFYVPCLKFHAFFMKSCLYTAVNCSRAPEVVGERA